MLKCKGQIIFGEMVVLNQNGSSWNVLYYNRNRKVEFIASLTSYKIAEKVYRNQIEVLRGI